MSSNLMDKVWEAYQGDPMDPKNDTQAGLVRVVAVVQQDRWMPIDTAPRDGTIVDLWAYRGDCGKLGYREGERYPNCCFAKNSFGTEPYGEPRWQGLNDRYIAVTPTHWMPVPAAPMPSADDLADKIEDLISEFGDDPKAAMECVAEHLSLRRSVPMFRDRPGFDAKTGVPV